MNYWNEEFLNVSANMTMNKGLYIYTDTLKAWSITLCFKKGKWSPRSHTTQPGHAILTVSPTSLNDSNRLREIFNPNEYVYKQEEIETCQYMTLYLELKNTVGLNSEYFILPKLESILPHFSELNQALKDTGLLQTPNTRIETYQSSNHSI